MKITVNLSKLTAACKLASDVADRRGVMQALACAKLSVADGPGGPGGDMLTISATDLTTSVSATVGGRSKSGSPGSVAIDAQELSRAVASFDGADAVLSVDEKHRLTITCGKARITLPGAKGDDMPKMPEPGSDGWQGVDAAFSSALERTVYAAGNDLTRPSLSGVAIDADGRVMKMFACNGQRLATHAIASTVPKMSILVPSIGVDRILAALNGDLGTIRVTNEYIHVAALGATVSVKLIQDKRMPFEQVIEKGLPASVIVDRAELLAAIRRAALVAPKSKDMPDGSVDFVFDADNLTVSSDGKHAGSAASTLVLKAKSKKKATVSLSSGYLLAALAQIETDDVEVAFKDETTQIQLRAPGSEAGLHLMMPRHGGK